MAVKQGNFEHITKHKSKSFADMKQRITYSYNNIENTIIACGGGTPCFFENLQWMQEKGTTIYLSTTAQEILQRVYEEQEKRPLLKTMNQAELLFFIEQKLKERAAFYNAANVIIPTAQLTEHSFGDLLSSFQSPS